jgi:hypothetical protein
MKKLLVYFYILSLMPVAIGGLDAQNKASFELGNGLNFSLNDGAYKFKIGGMIQPSLNLDKMNSAKPDYYFNVKRSFFNISGTALKEKVSFLLQTDFSLGSPLLDAWVAYMPLKGMDITFGQKQSIANNREMLIMEDKFQFGDRSILSTAFSGSGREFGLFISQKMAIKNIGFVPQMAVTSGDGRNSFGIDSRDTDKGGLKYSGRIDLYPLGFFTAGNEDLIADLAHEKKLKMVVGGAASYNDGASSSVGEGHGDFELYDVNGTPKFPDYRKFYGDILVKYRGFSFLGELAMTSATSLNGSYTATSISSPLVPTQISQYLALGTAFNTQLGYVTKNGYALDLRYDALMPEFGNNVNSIIKETTGMTVGLSKYFKQNNLKLQTSFSSFSYGDNTSQLSGSIIIQLMF